MGKYNKNGRHFDVRDFQHPSDKAAVGAIMAVPGFQKLLQYISEHSVERIYSFMNHSSRMKVTRQMSPMIFEMLDEAAKMYGMDTIPDVYLERAYEYRVTLEGINSPYIIFTTSLLEGVDEKQLWPIIASEFAGIQANHGTIKFIDMLLQTAKGILPFGIDQALSLSLNNWYRTKAYTYDRAILLASEDFELASEHILLGEAPNEVLESIGLNQPDNPYLEQAIDFLQRNGAEGVYQKIATAFTKDQWAASRYYELYKWYQSGKYHEVLEDSEV